MACKDVIEFLDDYFDGTLPWQQRLGFNIHLIFCRHCRQYLRSYATTVRMARSLAGPTEPPALREPDPEELVRAILAVQRGPFRIAPENESPAAEA